MVKVNVSKSNFWWIKWSRIAYCSALVGIIVGLITLLFKNLVEQYEHLLFYKAQNIKILFLILPLIGLTLIAFLRKYTFKNKKNKGISEVLEAVHLNKKLPAYKVVSHLFNGFLTVVFGGSTGIEVSTVVATATLGDLASKKDHIFKKYRKEFIGSAIACGVTLLFCSPLAGVFFSYETIGKQKSKVFWVTHLVSVSFATAVLFFMNVHPIFNTNNTPLNVPLTMYGYVAMLSLLAAIYGVYITKTVTFIKKISFLNTSIYLQILIGSLILGGAIYFLPELYGDGYHAVNHLVKNTKINSFYFYSLLLVLIIKPFATGFTLKLGGDGGVFAPSIFCGAILGALVASVAQNYFNAAVPLLPFVILGVAFTTSATLHAPFTAIFLTLGIFNNYSLWLPIAVFAFVSFYFSKKIFPYTVYTLAFQTVKK